ncbi:kinesin-related protein 4-like [Trifolium pratense]|uniref:Kinesin-related protein 4-like n=3 Tax=Trifolium TaxID=3898 RepID=A0A2K3NTZ7_TRIPR|nr:kinesin-related protein 4-like [Trifolium pratense]
MGSNSWEEAMPGSTGEERILVSVRVRPLNDKELARNDLSEWECINDTTIVYRSNLSASERSLYPTSYSFDRVFRTDCPTRQVYEEASKEVALSVLNGINSSIFAYGQTSSGKTYTMSGITEYAVADIFNYIEKHKEREFVLKFSAMEIYNESVRDLLSNDTTPLRLLDDPEKGTVVEKLTEETLEDWNHFTDLISFCETQRQIGETSLNEVSSRSHQILRLTIESSAREFLGNYKSSSLAASVNFVDLAGSERASQTNSAGTRLKEGCHINRSLLTLGTVIRKLSKGGRNGHIPFRDSKLTRILQSSIGGNARTAIICTMSPARSYVEQTRNTLLFASCAKEVSTNARVNVVISDKLLVKQLQRELARLEAELRNSGSNRRKADSAELLREKDLQIEMLKKEILDLALQRDLAHSQIKDMLQVVGDDMSSSDLDSLGPQYPKLRVRNSMDLDSLIDEPNLLNFDAIESVRSFDASQYSDGHSVSSEDNYFQLPDLEKSLPIRNSFQGVSIVSHDAVTNDSDQEIVQEQPDNKLGDICQKVRCPVSEDPITNTDSHSNPAGLSTNKDTDSNASSPRANTAVSGLIEVDNIDKENQDLFSSPAENTAVSGLTEVDEIDKENQDLFSSPGENTAVSGLTEVDNIDKKNQDSCSLRLKENKELNLLHRDFVLPSIEKIKPWLVEKKPTSSRILKLTRSRSCKASLMKDSSSDWFDQEEIIQNTPPIGIQKDHIGRPKDFERKTCTLNYNPNGERLSWAGYGNCERCSAVDMQNVKSSFDMEIDDDSDLSPVRKEKKERGSSNPPVNHEVAPKKFKNIGSNTLQSDEKKHLEEKHLEEKHLEWSSEFKRLQKEIIELWHSCNVSLVHRTYFFLLFKGEPSDSIYMEVERRRLSYLKDNQILEDGRTLTPESSKRYLRRERQMLSKQMQKKLSKSERENLYLKWGISMSSKHRGLQLAHRLWSETEDINHVRESATIVAKLVGTVEPDHAFKEMFGLNFAPRRRIKKSFGWTTSMKQIL